MKNRSVYETLPLKLSVNNDFLYRIDSKASIEASDVINSLEKSKVLLTLVFHKSDFLRSKSPKFQKHLQKAHTTYMRSGSCSTSLSSGSLVDGLPLV